jgi:RNA polymerase sigma-70 factor (ECF subfamily)
VHGAVAEPATSELDREDEAERRVTDALRAGDAHVALPLLMDRYGVAVYRYCRRMLGLDADGDDVSQTVFMQAFEAIQRRAPVENVRAWLLGIARNRCIDRLNRRRRGPVLVEEEELERATGDDGPREPPPGDPRAREVLDACLDKLDARSRAVVLLRFHDELSYESISRLTGDTPGALRVRVARALTALRHCMEKKGEAP